MSTMPAGLMPARVRYRTAAWSASRSSSRLNLANTAAAAMLRAADSASPGSRPARM